jgi:hypothetical protein
MILEKLEDVAIYLPLLKLVRSMYQHREDIMKHFEEYEILARKDLLSKRESFFVVHYNTSKKWKKRQCYIPDNRVASIEVDDSRYSSQYKPLINELVTTYKEYSERNLHVLLNKASNILKEIGWPDRYIKDKIGADCKEALVPIISKDLIEKGLNVDPKYVYDHLLSAIF